MNYLYEKACKYAFIVGMKTLELASYVANGFLYVYNNNIIAKQLTDVSYYYFDMLWCDYYNAKCNMPLNVNWYGTSCLVNNNQTHEINSIIRKFPIQQCYYKYIFKLLLFMQDGSSLLTDDEYTINTLHNDNDIDNCVSNIGDLLDNKISLIGDITDCIFLLEYFDMFIVRYAMHTDMSSPKLSEFVKSNVSFLSIEYTHPKMDNSIFFELGSRFSIIGNELFSPSFVKYLLEHQFCEYFFDNEYKLNIMDGNMDIQQLTHKQYIRLEENKFDIVEIATE